MNSIEKQFEAFSGTFYVLESIGFVFLIIIVLETAWDYFAKNRPTLGESIANFCIAIGNHFLDRSFYGLIFVLGLFLVKPYAFASIEETTWSWCLAVVIADLTYYWMHRFEHEVRILWAYHSVHHSSPEFNLTTGLRLAWVEGAIEWIFFVPMILIGFSPIQTIVGISIVVLYQTWIHTEKIGKLGWLDRIFNTPSVHRVHHGANKRYHDKNYGGILIVWDRIFGTYKIEDEKVVYGITTPVNTHNPLTINFHEYKQIAQDTYKAGNIRDLLCYLFRAPGWKPNQARH